MADEGNVHCDGGFSGYYGIDRDDGSFVHRIAEDGKEDMGPSARERKRWAVYEVSDKARQLKVSSCCFVCYDIPPVLDGDCNRFGILYDTND